MHNTSEFLVLPEQGKVGPFVLGSSINDVILLSKTISDCEEKKLKSGKSYIKRFCDISLGLVFWFNRKGVLYEISWVDPRWATVEGITVDNFDSQDFSDYFRKPRKRNSLTKYVSSRYNKDNMIGGDALTFLKNSSFRIGILTQN